MGGVVLELLLLVLVTAPAMGADVWLLVLLNQDSNLKGGHNRGKNC